MHPSRRELLAASGLLFASGAKAQSVFDVRQYKAVGDGRTVNTAAIQKAIDDCSAAGGGRVVFQQGAFVTGTLFLKSNVTLFAEGGASLLGSPNVADYATGTHRNMYAREAHMDRCLIFARDAENIGFEGKGAIDGQGKAFPNAGDGSHSRPMMIRILNCRNIFFRDITLRNPAAWTCAVLYSSDICVDGIGIDSRANGNGDGMDFDGCQNVRISNSRFNNSDDSICLQTSEPDRPVRNVVIDNCIMTSRWAAIRIGLLSRGSFEDITVSNCVFHDITGEGLKIQMNEGGRMNNLLFSDITMRNVPRPVFVTFNSFAMRVDSPGPPPPMQSLRNLMFSNIRIEADAASAESRYSGLIVAGLPEHPVEHVTFQNVQFTAPGGGTKQDADRRDVRELEGIRPEHNALGSALPSFGIYARHVRQLSVHDTLLEVSQPDVRPAVLCDDVEALEVTGLTVSGPARSEAPICLRNTRGASIRDSSVASAAEAFVQLEGEQTAGIGIIGNDLRHVRMPVRTSAGALSSSVIVGPNLMRNE